MFDMVMNHLFSFNPNEVDNDWKNVNTYAVIRLSILILNYLVLIFDFL